MDYQFKFWHALLNPSQFAFVLDHQDKDEQQEGYKILGYKSRLFLLLGIMVLFFVIRDFWGMGTESLTSIYASNLQEEYIVSRYLSAIGAAIHGVFFFFFHYFIITICLSILTDFSLKAISKIQLFVIASILIEKAVLFFVFMMVGYTTEISFLSFGPVSTYFTNDSFIIYFFNQLTLATIITIIIQYVFLSKWEEESKGLLLTKIIAVQIFFALVTAGLSILPLYDYIAKVVDL